MRAKKLIRATLAAGLLAGATFSAACAVEDEAVVDDIEDEALADEKLAADVVADKAAIVGSVSSRCDGRVTVWTSYASASTNHYKSASPTGPWQLIGSGVEVTVREIASRRYFKVGSDVTPHNSDCNRPGQPPPDGDEP